jgi:hypothetical protein
MKKNFIKIYILILVKQMYSLKQNKIKIYKIDVLPLYKIEKN